MIEGIFAHVTRNDAHFATDLIFYSFLKLGQGTSQVQYVFRAAMVPSASSFTIYQWRPKQLILIHPKETRCSSSILSWFSWLRKANSKPREYLILLGGSGLVRKSRVLEISSGSTTTCFSDLVGFVR